MWDLIVSVPDHCLFFYFEIVGEKTLGRALANLDGKAAAALPGIIGSIVSWLLNTAAWFAENLWAMAIAVGTLLLHNQTNAPPPQPKRH